MRNSWFASTPDTLRAHLCQTAQRLELKAGSRLFARGDVNDGMYCVLDGAVSIVAVNPAGKEVLLDAIAPVNWFGEIALLDGGCRTHDADIRVASQLVRVPREALESYFAQHPGDWRHIGCLVARKIRAVFTGLEDLALLPADARVARRLLAIASDYGDVQRQRCVNLNQEQLGAMLALSRQTVSEVLGRFEARGWVSRRYGEIELLDSRALKQAGEGRG